MKINCKAIVLIIVLIIFVIVSPGCNNNIVNNSEISLNLPVSLNLPDNISAIDDYSILLEDSFVFFSFTDDSTITFYRQYFDKRIENLYSIQNYIFNLGLYTFAENNLYFYVTTAISQEAVFENNEYENSIYSFNILTNKVEKVYTETKCLPGALIHSTNKYIVSRQSERDIDNNLSTYIEVYDIESSKVVNKSPVYVLNDNTNVGAYMMNICSDEDYIYALIDIRQENGVKIPSIYKFDMDFNIITVIELGSISDYILSSRVGNMSVHENIVFMRNYNGKGFIGEINENNIQVLVQEEGLDVAIQYFDNGTPLYYVRGNNTIYQYNNETCQLDKTLLDFEDDYMLKNILIKGDRYLITLFAYETTNGDKKEDKIFYVNKTTLHDIH